MSRRYSETTRMLEFALDLGGKLSHALNERLPEDARAHLLNAQRELITALVILYEQQAGTRRGGQSETAPARARGGAVRQGGGARTTSGRATATRSQRIKLD